MAPEDAVRKALDAAEEHLGCHKVIELGENRTDYREPAAPGPTSTGVKARLPSGKLPRGAKLPEEAYRRPILESLHELGGSAPVAEVLKLVHEKVKLRLGEVDYEMVPSGGAVRWPNTAMWTRKRLVREGLLKSASPKGIWELTDRGRAEIGKA